MWVVLEDAPATLADLLEYGTGRLVGIWGNVGLRSIQKKKSNTNVRTMSLPPREMMITSSDCKRRDERAHPKKKHNEVIRRKSGLIGPLP